MVWDGDSGDGESGEDVGHTKIEDEGILEHSETVWQQILSSHSISLTGLHWGGCGLHVPVVVEKMVTGSQREIHEKHREVLGYWLPGCDSVLFPLIQTAAVDQLTAEVEYVLN